MKNIINILLATILALATSNVYASSSVFTKAELELVKKQYQGQQWLMLLWSVDCPPCFKELAIIQKLKASSANLKVMLVNTDADEESYLERETIVKQFDLQSLANYHFVDGQGDQSRYAIDPQWYGELPRSYFFKASGESIGKSGLVNEVLIKKWLAL